MGQHALVTGASSGLGRELVRQLVSDRGMTVLATARRRDRLQELAAEFPPNRVLIEDGDLSDADFRERLWSRAEALTGGLDLLVNNAGLGNYSEFDGQDLLTIEQILAVNVVALADLTRKAIRHMKPRGSGQILQISSVLGFLAIPYSATYVASKHAVNGLVKALRYELHGSGVRVWAACPGRTESEFSKVALGTSGSAGPVPKGAATDKVVRAIVRGLDGRQAFLFPTWEASAAATAVHLLPEPFDRFMGRWSPGIFRREIETARGPHDSGA